jgi:hypothetical protein
LRTADNGGGLRRHHCVLSRLVTESERSRLDDTIYQHTENKVLGPGPHDPALDANLCHQPEDLGKPDKRHGGLLRSPFQYMDSSQNSSQDPPPPVSHVTASSIDEQIPSQSPQGSTYPNPWDHAAIQNLINEHQQCKLALQNSERQVFQMHQELQLLIDEHAETIHKLEDHITELHKRHIQCDNDNKTLRAYIANMKIAQAQTKADSYYVDRLQNLNRLIQSSVAGIFVDSDRQRTLKKEGSEVLEILSKLTPYGKFTAELLKTEGFDTIWTLHQDASKRVALARHIVALFLKEQIFFPFIFGVPSGLSNMMRNIEEDVVAIGE